MKFNGDENQFNKCRWGGQGPISSCGLLSAHKRHVWEELMIPQATVKSHSSATPGYICQYTDRVRLLPSVQKITKQNVTDTLTEKWIKTYFIKTYRELFCRNYHYSNLLRGSLSKDILTSIEVYKQLPSWSDPPGALRSKRTANGPQTSWLPEAGVDFR